MLDHSDGINAILAEIGKSNLIDRVSIKSHKSILSKSSAPAVLNNPIVGSHIGSPIRFNSSQQHTMSSNIKSRIIGRNDSWFITGEHTINWQTNTHWSEGEKSVCKCIAVHYSHVVADLEPPLSHPWRNARSILSLIGVLILSCNFVDLTIWSYRVEISSLTGQIGRLEGRQAVHHLLLRQVQIEVVLVEIEALNFSNTSECPAGTTCALILNAGHITAVDAVPVNIEGSR
jgi:hypothetical protein